MSKALVLQPKAEMTATQRRMAIEVARDVLLQLKLKRLQAQSGTYLELEKQDEEGNACGLSLTTEFGKSGSFQKTFQQNTNIKCTVCAIGAAYVSYINRFNKVKNSQVISANSNAMVKTLGKIFPGDQLRLMEAVFECGWVREPEWFTNLENEYYSSDETGEQVPAFEHVNNMIEAFYYRYADDDKRLRAIMTNVIRNNGEFRLPLRAR